MRRFLLFITSMAHFSMPNSVPISWLYIIIVCIRVSNSFSFLANSLMSSMYISGWSFLVIYWVCIQLCIFWECDWVASLLLQIVMVIMHLPRICLSRSLPLLSFSPLLSIPLSMFPHNLHLLFCSLLPILALIWLIPMALFWGAIRRDSVSLVRFPPFLKPCPIFLVRDFDYHDYHWYHCHVHVPQLFQFHSQIKEVIYLFAFFYFEVNSNTFGQEWVIICI